MVKLSSCLKLFSGLPCYWDLKEMPSSFLALHSTLCTVSALLWTLSFFSLPPAWLSDPGLLHFLSIFKFSPEVLPQFGESYPSTLFTWLSLYLIYMAASHFNFSLIMTSIRRPSFPVTQFHEDTGPLSVKSFYIFKPLICGKLSRPEILMISFVYSFLLHSFFFKLTVLFTRRARNSESFFILVQCLVQNKPCFS